MSRCERYLNCNGLSGRNSIVIMVDVDCGAGGGGALLEKPSVELFDVERVPIGAPFFICMAKLLYYTATFDGISTFPSHSQSLFLLHFLQEILRILCELFTFGCRV